MSGRTGRIDELRQRYQELVDAMQSGVTMDHELGAQDGSHKHLRVGVSSALCDLTALKRLLMAKGLITEEEYLTAAVEEMERQVARYQERVGNRRRDRAEEDVR